jgi:hypothetical protein
MKTNFRVVVTARVSKWDAEVNRETEEKACKRIASQIERHIDDVDSVEIKWDSNE